MPTVRVYRHGMTVGTPPSVNTHKRALRGKVEGWSPSSTRSNTRFLYSVDESRLNGLGMALSLLDGTELSESVRRAGGKVERGLTEGAIHAA